MNTNQDWLDDDGFLTMGKYKGEHVGDVVSRDPDYLEWVLENTGVSDADRVVIEIVLKRVGRVR